MGVEWHRSRDDERTRIEKKRRKKYLLDVEIIMLILAGEGVGDIFGKVGVGEG